MEKVSHKNHRAAKGNHHYKILLIMIVISFISMYVLMYAMVNVFNNVYMNTNQFYMAGLMATAMVIIELALMWSMYKNKRLNMLIMAISVVALIAFWLFIRQQTVVSDKQFLKSMIPHHAGAILMCEKANIKDPEIIKLCEQIRTSQKAEIDQMKTILERLKK
jgi:uncharacterized protein (DUF305 family)